MTEQDELTWPNVYSSLLARHDLDAGQARWAMRRIMAGEASPAQVAAFLVALRAKGETSAEIRVIADTMLELARRIDVPGPTVDVVGTGGDRANTVNISTMASMVVAATGTTVVKHGNRAASSKSGTADCLEALGITLTLSPQSVADCALQAGITFCFAQTFHPSMRHAGPVRAELAIPTVFNVLGPLTNPAQPDYAAVGVADARMAPLVAGVFAARGRRTAVFRGDDGLDELTVSTTSSVWWVDGGVVTPFVLDPADHDIEPAPLSALRGGDAEHNAAVVLDVFDGASGPIRDAVTLNAGIAVALASAEPVGTQSQFTRSLQLGIERARDAIDSGAAATTLSRWRQVTQELSG